jgi:TrbL/VirB6 plasmid conjugal transfer protein
MGGSVTMQYLWTAYSTNLTQTVTTEATTILGQITATVQGAVMIYILILGKQMVGGSMTFDLALTRLIRAIIVVALLSAANYQTFIATPITTTIPNFVNTMITGQQGLAGAQGWDALMNQVYHLGEQLHSQAVGLVYIGERITIWLFVALAWIVIMISFMIWMLAGATADLLVPLGAIVIPFYLFDATRNYAERWVGKIVSLFLVMIITMMLGQIVVYQDGQFLSKYSNNIAAAPAAQGFNMTPDIDNMGLGPTTPGDVAGATINVDSGIATLGNAIVVFMFGMFLLTISSGIALFIGGSSGFSARPVFNAIGSAGGLVTRAAIRR